MKEKTEAELGAMTGPQVRRYLEDKCMVPDRSASKQLWKDQFLSVSGHAKRWTKQYKVVDGAVVLANEVDYVEPPVHRSSDLRDYSLTPDVVVDSSINEVPEILYVDNQRHNSFSILQVKGGWCVVTYGMDNGLHIVKAVTEPESKNFALNRLFGFIRTELRYK